MSYFYDLPNGVKVDKGPPIDPLRCDATRIHCEHFANLLTLTFFSNNGSIAEKKQASLEMEICERKMKFWGRQPHFIQAEAVRRKSILKRQWER